MMRSAPNTSRLSRIARLTLLYLTTFTITRRLFRWRLKTAVRGLLLVKAPEHAFVQESAVKQSACRYLLVALLMLAVHSVRAEVIFFDDSDPVFMVAPTSTRWTPGHDGGICSSSTAGPGALCGAGSFSEQSVWGYLAAPPSLPGLPGVTLDTDLSHYDVLHPAIPFNNFLWVTETLGGPIDLYSDYLVSYLYTDAIYLQFNSAFAAGFHCTDFLVATDCANPRTIAETDGIVTAGYVRWSDGSYDQITFQSLDAIPEPSSVLLLAAGFILLIWRFRKARPQFG